MRREKKKCVPLFECVIQTLNMHTSKNIATIQLDQIFFEQNKMHIMLKKKNRHFFIYIPSFLISSQAINKKKVPSFGLAGFTGSD